MKNLNTVINEAIVKQHISKPVGGKARISEIQKQIDEYQKKIDQLQNEINGLNNQIYDRIKLEDLPCNYNDVLIYSRYDDAENWTYGNVRIDDGLEYLCELIDFIQDKRKDVLYKVQIWYSGYSGFSFYNSDEDEDKSIGLTVKYDNNKNVVPYTNYQGYSIEQVADEIIKKLK